jgi:glucose-6-phosphate isomerase
MHYAYTLGGLRISISDYVLKVNGKEAKASVRNAGEMGEVLYDRSWLKGKEAMQLYYMYRDIADFEKLRKYKVRYDITIMRPLRLGKELNKTLGHYHPVAEKGLSYPELYEVLDGEAIYLLQKPLHNGVEAVLINAKKGDKVLIPPNYGHITINAGKKDLVMANLVSSVFESNYKPILKKHGGAVYVLSDMLLALNRNYGDVHMHVLDNPGSFVFKARASLLDLFVLSPHKFRFLNKPSLLRLNLKKE